MSLGFSHMLHNVSYKRSSGIGALTFQIIPDFQFIKLPSDFALTRYCVYAMLQHVFPRF
jgi:hypothetical protein